MSEGTETTATDTQSTNSGAEVPVDDDAKVAETAKEDETSTAETLETDGEDAGGDSEEKAKPKRLSGSKKLARKNQWLQSDNLNLRDEIKRLKAEAEASKIPVDHGGDFTKEIVHEATKGVKDELRSAKLDSLERQLVERNREIIEDFNDRADEFKTKATDFDEVVDKFARSGGEFSLPVRELILESEVGPQLTYHLAKNPVIANKLNSLPPLQAAKEVARLEDTLSKPSLKPTNAPKPLTKIGGGASTSTDLLSLAKSDDATDYIQQRRKERALGR